MRIGIATPVIQRGQTGIAQYVFALTRVLAAQVREHDFTLFVLEDDLPLFDFAKTTMQLRSVAERFRPPVKSIFWHQTELPRLARALGLDVLHVPSYRRMLWPRPCALVATIHDLAPFRVKHKYDWKRMLYGRLIVPRLARRQHEIIAVSQQTARDIATCLRLPAGRVTVIHNGVDHERFFPSARAETPRAAAERFDLRQPFFLYVARLEHPAKNHVRLIEAFNRFKAETKLPWQLALGGSDWHGAEAIHDAIRQSPFGQDIRSLGFVADADLPGLYRAAEVFVYPSLYEGFGLPPIEAMACGCPVLCSTRGALGEVVGDAAATVEPEDIAGMKWQLVRLAGDPGLREQLRLAGLARAEGFDWSQTAAATVEVYSRAAIKSKTSAAVFSGESELAGDEKHADPLHGCSPRGPFVLREQNRGLRSRDKKVITHLSPGSRRYEIGPFT